MLLSIEKMRSAAADERARVIQNLATLAIVGKSFHFVCQKSSFHFFVYIARKLFHAGNAVCVENGLNIAQALYSTRLGPSFRLGLRNLVSKYCFTALAMVETSLVSNWCHWS